MRHDLRHVLAFYIFALIGMGFFLWLPLIAYTQNEWRYEQGQDVEGEVISLRSTEDGRRIGYRFVDEQGDVHEGSDTMEGPRATQYHQGDRISIEYLTETPSKNRIYNVAKVGLTGGYVFLGLLGLLTLAFPIRPVIQAGLRARRARTLYRAGVRVEGEVVAHRDTRYAFERRALKRLWIRCRHGGRASRVLACPVVDPEDYPVGTPITVFVDPRDPERFTWERPLKAPRAEPRELV